MFTVIDAIVAVVIVMSAILAYSRGFVREGMAIAGWVAAAVLAYLFAPKAVPLVRQIPGLDSILGTNCELSLIAAFAAVFALALIVVSLFTPLFSSIVQRSALGGLDQGLGFLFGVARGLLLVAVGFLVYNKVMSNQPVPIVDDSRSAQVFAQFSDRLAAQLPTDVPGWVAQGYEGLVGTCGAPVGTTTDTGAGSAAGTVAPQAPVADGTIPVPNATAPAQTPAPAAP